MKLFLLRHGKTIFNQNNIMQGQVDSKLTKGGRIQAEKLAEILIGNSIDKVYSSNLGRCKETITPFLDISGVPVEYCPELRERNYGIYDGGPSEDWQNFLHDNGYWGNFNFRPPEGESFYEVQERVTQKIEDIVQREKGKNILVVSHGSALISFLIGQFEEGPTGEIYEKYRFDNTAYSIIDFNSDGKIILERHNCTDHLNSYL